MKRCILILTALFLIGLNAISQNSFGLEGGINLANQTSKFTSTPFQGSSKIVPTKPLTGYKFGFFYKAKISKKLTLSTGADLSVIGAGNLL